MKKLLILLFVTGYLNTIAIAQNDQSPGFTMDKNAESNYRLFEYVESFQPHDYYEMLDSLKANRFDDFFSLRMAYTRTKEYDPYDKTIRDQHKRMQKLMEAKKYSEALMVADSILTVNFVDISVHLYCGYIYKQLNDEENSNLHYNIFDGFIFSIISTGDGKSPQTAFVVINTTEEFHILEHFGMKYFEQSLISEDDYDFDLLKARGIKDKKEYDVYFNVTLPYGTLKK